MNGPLQQIDAPRGSEVPAAADEFLRALGAPTLLRVAGVERGRRRAASTLLHGNEPSGLRAMHAWLRGGETPAVDTVLLVANVEAALAPPGFAWRALPGRADLNRCFLGPFEGAEGRLARALLDALLAAEPECLIDLHNNTGHNPPYGVGPDASPACLSLTARFGERFVHSRLRLGSLVEATQGLFPSVTIECGRAGDPAADALALAGLTEYLSEPRPMSNEPPSDRMQLLSNPVRVCAAAGIELAFGSGPHDGADLTVREDIDRHNFEPLAPGLPIGWLGPRGIWPLEAIDSSGHDVSHQLFAERDGLLSAKRGFTPIMMTTDERIALSDCLFYLVDSIQP